MELNNNSNKFRSTILTKLAKYTGRRVPADFIKRTTKHIKEVERFHNLITGIYKPVWSEYALTIMIKLDSPYKDKDEVIFLEDGRWLMTYSPRSGGLKLSDNQALLKCMEDKMPIGVFKQLTDKTNRQFGSTYRVVGLGIVTKFDSSSGVFIVEGIDQRTINVITNYIVNDEERYEVQLYSQLTNEFNAFSKEETVSYKVSLPKRDSAFRKIVLHEYNYTCAVCEMKFHFGNIVEATVAHIVSKREHGTDDPRNGLSLCHTHHWAFDKGIFTLSDEYAVQLSPSIRRAETQNFSLLNMDEKPILLPNNDALQPHLFAMGWHRDNKWLR